MKKRNIIILVILLAIGFASVSTTLVLNGIVGIGSSEDEFDVIFTDATINGEDSEVTINETKKKITFSSSKLTKVGEKAILDYKIKNNSTQYDANVTINCTSDETEFIKVTNELEGEEITEDYTTTFTAQEEKSGVITAELIKSAVDESDSIELTCTIVASATERDSAIEPVKYSWEITEDNDNNGEVSNGDLITLGTESFYVYNTEGDTIKAISQYNLEVGNSSNSGYPSDEETNIQSSRAMGYKSRVTTYATVRFSSNDKKGEKDNSYTGSIVEEYVNNYVSILKTRYNVEVTGRLITKEELETLGCDSSSYTCSSVPSYITSTSYWTSSPDVDDDLFVWFVNSFSIFLNYDVSFDNYFGVRPVIEIPKSLFE